MIEKIMIQLDDNQLDASRPHRHQGAETASIWLDCFPDNQMGRSLYLINGSNEILTWVRACPISSVTIDDNAFGGGGEMLCYQGVAHGQAVKIDQYDEFYDLDYSISVEVSLFSECLGQQKFSPTPRKGGLKKVGFVWRTTRTADNGNVTR